MPLAVKFTPQAPAAEQVRVRHSVSEPLHCEATLHATHAPVALQKAPPFWVHTVLTATVGFDGVPFVQTSLVHWLLSTGRSLFVLTTMGAPKPSHSFVLQSPAVCVATGTIAGVFVAPHAPAAEQVRVRHSVSEPLHCEATLQATQAPVALQKVPPF